MTVATPTAKPPLRRPTCIGESVLIEGARRRRKSSSSAVGPYAAAGAAARDDGRQDTRWTLKNVLLPSANRNIFFGPPTLKPRALRRNPRERARSKKSFEPEPQGGAHGGAAGKEAPSFRISRPLSAPSAKASSILGIRRLFPSWRAGVVRSALRKIRDPPAVKIGELSREGGVRHRAGVCDSDSRLTLSTLVRRREGDQEEDQESGADGVGAPLLHLCRAIPGCRRGGRRRNRKRKRKRRSRRRVYRGW